MSDIFQTKPVTEIAQWGGYEQSEIYDSEEIDDDDTFGLDDEQLKERVRDAYQDTYSLSLATEKLLPFKYPSPTQGYKRITLTGVGLTDDELRELVAAEPIRSCEFLDVQKNTDLSTQGMVEIIRSGKLSHMRFLSIDRCVDLGDEVLRVIADGAIPNLEGLVFGATDITDDGMAAITNSENLPKLQYIEALFVKNISETTMVALAKRHGLKSLRMSVG